MITPDEFSRLISHAKHGKNRWTGKCPAHDDRQASLSWWNREGGGTVVVCYAQCDIADILRPLNLSVRDLYPDDQKSGFPNHDQPGKPKKRIIAEYNYCDETGQMLFQAVRFDPKGFSQRQPDGKNWKWSLEGVRRVLYRLPELLADESDASVFIVEGEKDVENLRALGLVATCNPQGAGKWRTEYNRALSGRRVAILPDNDDAGSAHAASVQNALTGLAESVCVVKLPNLPKKGDVSDWLTAGGSRDELLALTDRARADLLATNKAMRQRAENTAKTEGLPVIDLGIIRDLPGLSGLAWQAVISGNTPKRLFRRARMPYRIETDEAGRPSLADLTENRMRYEIARAAKWQTNGQMSKPPLDVCKDMLATDSLPLPPLNRIVGVPVFACCGRLETDPGYQQSSRNYYAPSAGISVKFNAAPTRADVDDALRLIVDDLLCDFPFAEQSDRANAIGLMILPFVRDMIAGPTPHHLIEASLAGSGKGLLADVLMCAGIGKDYTVMIPARDDDEWRKRITTALKENREAILMDNLNHTLDSGAFAAALTLETWSDRVLGSTATITVPIRCVWITTSNNPTLSEEVARRTIRIRLVPKTDSPQERSGFRHESLKEWIFQNRSRLIEAAHTLIQFWIQQGRPAPKARPLGSYEDWTRVIGGVLETAGVAGFLDNYRALQTRANPEREAWREFTNRWWDLYGEKSVTIARLLPLAEEIEGFNIRGDSDRARTISFGKILRFKIDAVYGGRQIICRGLIDGMTNYLLRPLQTDPFSPNSVDVALNSVDVVDVKWMS